MNNDQTIGIIGTGNMGNALLKGFIESKSISTKNIYAYDADENKVKNIASELNIEKASTIDELVKVSDIIFFAVKPQNIEELLRQIPTDNSTNKLFVSVLAGTPIETFEDYLGDNAKIIRLMPNTPCLVNAGMIALSKNNYVSDKESDFIKKLLEPTGELIEVDEKDMDAVTALSGSGPAYIFMIIQAMSNAGVKLGLTQEQSLKLATQTTYGAAKLVSSTGEHPEILKDKVSSPGGTTIYALHELEDEGLRGIIMNAVEACYNRSIELKDDN
ncbi:pyrroline-5-carboxylate reductase [Natranaerofaba carboxydovora]|uniref:pyrroline-5-carboxylate reductase n=1 Tax=Natranaerofaba carboxydovora TaxID=2742683 RepID=UPI001F1340B1|nr:pyrroline-5-carboxylate reductase [Natranaerofaba carboxydovora]UMZ74079.1 Pyrroline-5-carboxylate reductase [Natranaerofaba carboxydovora]